MEKAGDTAVFTFGRFNPPTTGHEKLIGAVAKQQSKNAGSKMYIYASQSNDPKKNPLPYAKKIAYMRKMFKKYSKNITTGKPRTAIEVAVELHNKGHRAIVMVVGSDRVQEFETLLNEYNGVEGKRHGYYGFDNIEVVSAGARDPDAEGVEGMSASKMRDAAADGDFQSFEMGVPSSFAQRKELYRDVRKGMGMREEREMGDMTDREYLRDLYLTGKIWNAGDIIEAKGVTGSIVRKGTNYVSFADDDGKVHKCWIHEIELNEAMSNSEGLYEVSWESPPTHNDPLITVKDSKGQHIMHANLSTAHSFWKLKEFSKNKEDLIKKIHKAGINGEIKVTVGKKGQTAGHSNHPNPMGSVLTITLSKSHKKQVNERNYSKEYANYQGTPEQIARRSSRNKARRIMGDKTKVGMDVGHKDNDPMNNDPSNLRNEVPSDNRREPRLRDEDRGLPKAKRLPSGSRKLGGSKKLPSGSRKLGGSKKLTTVSTVKPVKPVKPKKAIKAGYYEEVELDELRIDPKTSSEEDIKNQIKYHEKMRDKFSGNARAKKAQNDDIKRLQGILKDRGFKEEVELDELSSMLPWLDRAVAKASQITHPKGWDTIVKRYVDGMKDKEHQKHPSAWAADLARQYKGINGRDLVKYINKLVDKGKLPQELKAEYEIQSFKSFVETLNKNADQGDYIDDFIDSDAPQFKGKSKKKRVAMAVAAYKNK